VETRTRYGFDYAIDNVGSAFAAAINGGKPGFNGFVIVDPHAYANFLKNSSLVDPFTAAAVALQTPQAELQKTKGDVVKVATFVRSSVDLQSHELALPVSLRYDLTDRLHAEVTVAPTLTIADADTKTERSLRSLNDFGQPETKVLQRGNPPLFGITALRPGGGFGTPFNVPPVKVPVQLPPPQSPPPASPVAASGKGAIPQAPDFPGEDVGNRRSTQNMVDVLFGVKTQASLIFDLNEEKTIYAQLWGGYHWVQDMHVSNGLGESSIDLSGFEAGIGLGFRF
jgi:hypothetical protein